MKIPSYDDLTPSIPDVSPGDALASVARVLPASPPVAEAAPRGEFRSDELYACLRAPRTSEAAMAIAREFSPRIQRHGPACIVLDVSGLGRLLGDPAAIGTELARAAAERGSALRIAVAPTQIAARLLSLVHAGLNVATGDPAAILARVPLVHLEQLVAEAQDATIGRGASRSVTTAARKRHDRAFDMLRRWGLATLGEFAALPAGDLSARMGQDGLRLQQLARGVDPAPLVPAPDVPRFVERMELEWPIEALEPLSFVLARLLDPLAAALERADRGAAALRLDLRLVDRTVHARVLQLPAAMRDPRVLRTLLLLDLESHPPAAAIDIVTIEADPAPGRVLQYSLLERALPSAETLATLTARLGALVGDARCGSPVLLDTHRPDGFELRRFDPSAGPAAGSGSASPGTAHAMPSAMTGDGAGASLSPGLRRFRPPVAVRVAVEGGRPAHVAIDRRGMPGGRVEQHAGPWRSSGAWWDHGVTYWDRDEWDVALSDGSLCRLFRARDTGAWFLDGVID